MSSASPTITAEARQQLHLALILHLEKYGGGGSSGRIRRSLHLKIVGDFQAELEQLRASAGFLGEELAHCVAVFGLVGEWQHTRSVSGITGFY